MILVDMKFPASSISVFSTIKSLVTFEVIPGDIYGPFQEQMIDLPSDKVFYEQMNQVGYESGYIIASMFLTFVFFAIFLIRIFSDFAIVKCVWFKKFKCCKSIIEGSKRRLA